MTLARELWGELTGARECIEVCESIENEPPEYVRFLDVGYCCLLDFLDWRVGHDGKTLYELRGSLLGTLAQRASHALRALPRVGRRVRSLRYNGDPTARRRAIGTLPRDRLAHTKSRGQPERRGTIRLPAREGHSGTTTPISLLLTVGRASIVTLAERLDFSYREPARRYRLGQPG